MISNYKYFLALAEELSISKASEKLFISHQGLSKYLKLLEEEFGIIFFERKPKFSLTPAGKILLEKLRQIELIEKNIYEEIQDIKNSNVGVIRFGITEGRYSIVIPKLLKKFYKKYPNVKLKIFRKPSLELQNMIHDNSLDLFLASTDNLEMTYLKAKTIINESLYVVISDNLLKEYFPATFPKCKKNFKKGVDLKSFEKVPFILSEKKLASRILLDKYLENASINLNCINELAQPEIFLSLASEDYAASFCLSMYLSGIKQFNSNKNMSNLNIFPIRNFSLRNNLSLIYHKNKKFASYFKDFMETVKEICNPYT